MAPPTAPRDRRQADRPSGRTGPEGHDLDVGVVAEPGEPVFSDPGRGHCPDPLVDRPCETTPAGGRLDRAMAAPFFREARAGAVSAFLETRRGSRNPEARAPTSLWDVPLDRAGPAGQAFGAVAGLPSPPVARAIAFARQLQRRAFVGIVPAGDGAAPRFRQPLGRQGEHLGQQTGVRGLLPALRMLIGSAAICGCLGSADGLCDQTFPSHRRCPLHQNPPPTSGTGTARARWATPARHPEALAPGVRTVAGLSADWCRGGKLAAGNVPPTMGRRSGPRGRGRQGTC